MMVDEQNIFDLGSVIIETKGVLDMGIPDVEQAGHFIHQGLSDED